MDPQVLGLVSSGYPGASVGFPDLHHQLHRLIHYVWQVRRAVPQAQPRVGAHLVELQEPFQGLVCEPRVGTARGVRSSRSLFCHVCALEKDVKRELNVIATSGVRVCRRRLI